MLINNILGKKGTLLRLAQEPSLMVLSVGLLIISFPSFNFNYLAFIGFVPLFFAIQNKSPIKAFWVSYICGFLFYLGVLYWLGNVTVIGLVILCLYLAVYYGIFGFIVSLLNKSISSLVLRFSSFVNIISIPAIWVVLEYIQAHLFTGFGWALLGYTQYKNLPFIQIADFSGVYGVSFVIMLVNVLIWRMIVKFKNQDKGFRKDILIISCWLFVIFVSIYLYGFFRLGEVRRDVSTIRLSVIQGNIPQDIKWAPFAQDFILNRYLALTKKASLDKPDLIIWTETAFPGFWGGWIDNDLTNKVLDLVKEIKTSILLGANTEEGLDNFNSAVLIRPLGVHNEPISIDKYDKVHLVPFGEYVPFSSKFPVLHNLVFGELGEFTKGSKFKVFELDDRLRYKFAVLICYEDIFPEISKRFVQDGAQFLIVITNDAWYGKSSSPYQHTASSVFRAIENRVPVIRSANTGYSCFIDLYGRIYDAVQKDGVNLFITGYKTADVHVNR